MHFGLPYTMLWQLFNLCSVHVVKHAKTTSSLPFPFPVQLIYAWWKSLWACGQCFWSSETCHTNIQFLQASVFSWMDTLGRICLEVSIQTWHPTALLHSSQSWRSEFHCWHFQLLTSGCSRCTTPQINKKLGWLWQWQVYTLSSAASLQIWMKKRGGNDTCDKRCQYTFILGNMSKYSIYYPNENTKNTFSNTSPSLLRYCHYLMTVAPSWS